MLEGHWPETVLEVGCNRGHNIQALQAILPDSTVAGVEPQAYARKIALGSGLAVEEGDIYDIPYGGRSVDLVLVCGVLIHVPPEELGEALRELGRVSARWVLAIEYASDSDVALDYRGLDGMLWKRDYGSHILEALGLSESALADTGSDVPGFDGATFWLIDKTLKSG